MPGQLSMLDRHDGMSWMSHDREVVAHLRVAADEVREVMVEAGGRAAPGVLSLDPADSNSVRVSLGGGAILPSAAPGMVVKVSYGQDAVRYEFLTSVIDREDHGRLRAAVPRVISRREKRAAPRLNVFKGRCVHLASDWGANFTVFDISTSGIGLISAGDDVRRAMAQGVRGVLTLTPERKVNVWLDVRHTRWLEEQRATLIGARFLGLTGRDAQVIHQFIDTRLGLG